MHMESPDSTNKRLYYLVLLKSHYRLSENNAYYVLKSIPARWRQLSKAVYTNSQTSDYTASATCSGPGL
jgi:hypothetical protein